MDEPALHAVGAQVLRLDRRDLHGGTAAAGQVLQSEALVDPQVLQLLAPGPEGFLRQARAHDLDHVVDEGRVVGDDEGPPGRVKGQQHVGLVVEPSAAEARAGGLQGGAQDLAVHAEVKAELEGRIPEQRHRVQPRPVQSLVAPVEEEPRQQARATQGLRRPQGIAHRSVLEGPGRRCGDEVAVENDDASRPRAGTGAACVRKAVCRPLGPLPDGGTGGPHRARGPRTVEGWGPPGGS